MDGWSRSRVGLLGFPRLRSPSSCTSRISVALPTLHLHVLVSSLMNNLCTPLIAITCTQATSIKLQQLVKCSREMVVILLGTVETLELRLGLGSLWRHS